jgi:hypothetical protein
MSGSVYGLGTGVLSLFGSSSYSNGASSILTTLYGGGSSVGGAGSGNPIQALQIAEQDQTQDIATTAKEPSVARDISTFENAVATAKTPADVLNNPAALKVLLTANGMSDQVQYTALAQKALLSNPSDSSSLVNQLSDTRWKTVATTYNFATQGLSVLKQPKVLADIANGYAEVTWRQSLDATTPGLSNALTFKSEASTVTSALQILGDPVMRDVVTTALNIPQQIAFQDLGAQQRAITDRVDLTRFKDPTFVNGFIDQYLLAKQQAATSSAGTTPDLTSLAVQAGGLVV